MQQHSKKSPEQLMLALLEEWGAEQLAQAMSRALNLHAISKPICEILSEKEESATELWQLKKRFEEMI